MNPNTCILFFSNTANHEARSKQYDSSLNRWQNQTIASSLIRRSLSLIKQSQLPYYMIDESKQVGSTFGQRLCSAIDHVFTVSDYEHIIILGNDCLDLTLSEITQSAALLAQGNQVIGLTQCDGAYLIGINRAHYTRRGLESIGWQTDALVSDLMAYFSSTAVQLEDKIELNHLSRLAHLATTVLCQCIARLLSHVRATLSVASRILLHHIYQVQIPILRGPPQVI